MVGRKSRIVDMEERAVLERIELSLVNQMEIQNAMYPLEIPVLQSAPSTIEFARMVHSNFPAVIKHVVDDMPAMKWTPQSLKHSIGNLKVPVAETPLGNADSPFHNMLFVQPHIRQMEVGQLIDYLQGSNSNNPVRYMQSQDSNLESQFKTLTPDVYTDFEFAHGAVGDKPSAINVWLGNSYSTSRLHSDNFDNLFVQVHGHKRIYLIPPGDAYALDERFLVGATYQKTEDGSFVISIDGTDKKIPADASTQEIQDVLNSLELTMPRTMFPTVDPSDPSTHNSIFKNHCRVYSVDLGPGDMLYIPALWYHQVQITGPPTELCVSLNYWYAVDSISPLWAKWNYVRASAAALRGYNDPHFFDPL